MDTSRDGSAHSCGSGEHDWVACFFREGDLAYWVCEDCGLTDRDIEALPGRRRLDTISAWIKSPPRMRARGELPPVSSRKWATDRNTVLLEGDPSSVWFMGLEIPGLEVAHSYEEQDADGNVLESYVPGIELRSPHSDRYTLLRYQVVWSELLLFRSYCFEDSTYGVPNAKEPKRRVVLERLRQLSP